MRSVTLPKQLKISFGLFVFGFILIGIAGAFLISVGMFLKIVGNYALNMGSLLGPFMFIALLLIIATLCAGKKSKAVFFNISVVFITLGMVDTAKVIWPSFDIKNLKRSTVEAVTKKDVVKKVSDEKPTIMPGDIHVFYENQDEYFIESDVLGYAPSRSRRTHTYSTYHADTLFNVHYTIDENGQRLSPPFFSHPDARSALFFGCSLTFGYGLNDHETLPYMTGYKTNGMLKVYNFAFNGYGTHQMVSSLEHGHVESIVKVPPKYIFYLAIPAHMDRIKNNKDWGFHDPKYVMNDAGEVAYKGHFDEYGSEIVRKAVYEFKVAYAKIKSKSYVLQLLDVSNSYDREYSEEDQQFFVAMIAKARDLAKIKYPDAEFHVIYSVMNVDTEKEIISMLHDRKINVHLISDVIPDYVANFKSYWIKYPIEPHPNAKANDKISNYIVQNIIDYYH